MAGMTEGFAELVAERFKALGEPMRLRLLNALRGGEQSVGALVEATGAGQANVSKHLQVLHRHGFVERRKEGVVTWYRIADARVFDLCEMVCEPLRLDVEQKRRILGAPARRR